MPDKPTVCEHGSLKRQCRICELEAELAEARKTISGLNNENADLSVLLNGDVMKVAMERDTAIAEAKRMREELEGNFEVYLGVHMRFCSDCRSVDDDKNWEFCEEAEEMLIALPGAALSDRKPTK